ncbi:hypothetical protein REPUB_Repub06bG0072200 [Reevesia pubescens]
MKAEIEILLDLDNVELETIMKYTLIGKIMIEKMLNQRGVRNVFKIQIHNLPLVMLKKANAEKIGRVIGELVHVEDPLWIHGCGRGFLCVRVAVKDMGLKVVIRVRMWQAKVWALDENRTS